MSRDPKTCPYWTAAMRAAQHLTDDLALQDRIARSLCDAYETGRIHGQEDDDVR